jgi:hypothetical protein
LTGELNSKPTQRSLFEDFTVLAFFMASNSAVKKADVLDVFLGSVASVFSFVDK